MNDPRRDGRNEDQREEESAIEPELHEKLCEYVFGELDEAGRREVEERLERDPVLAAERERLEATTRLVTDALPEARLSDEAMRSLLERANRREAPRPGPSLPWWRLLLGGNTLRLAAAAALVVAGTFTYRNVTRGPSPSGGVIESMLQTASAPDRSEARPMRRDRLAREERQAGRVSEELAKSAQVAAPETPEGEAVATLLLGVREEPVSDSPAGKDDLTIRVLRGMGYPSEPASSAPGSDTFFLGQGESAQGARTGNESFASAAPRARGSQTLADSISGARNVPAADGDDGSPVRRGRGAKGAAEEPVDQVALQKLEGLGYVDSEATEVTGPALTNLSANTSWGDYDLVREEPAPHPVPRAPTADELIRGCRIAPDETPTEMLVRCWGDHPFVSSRDETLSTFAADVDTASYGLVRRYLAGGMLPPRELVRTEELVNALRDDPVLDVGRAADAPPFDVSLEAAPSPFFTPTGAHAASEAWMLRVRVAAPEVHPLDRQPVALTFVVDVSGSMDQPDRLPLVKRTLQLLLDRLDSADFVALVAFSTEAEVLTGPVSAANRGLLEDRIAGLSIGGGTNVEAGLRAGFEVAEQGLSLGSVNRVVLLSDGVGNLGQTDQAKLLEATAGSRDRGIYLNTVGVGLGDHADHFLEQLADRGDGVCTYVGSEEEARKALIEDFTGAFQPVARDVKIQVEVDGGQVLQWRQLGYENRALRHEDFRNDAVDAGEINAGHQVTALYELVLPGGPRSSPPAVTVRVRWKPPFAVDAGSLAEADRLEAEVATELEQELRPADVVPSFPAASLGFRRSVAVAQLAEFLRRSVHTRGDSYEDLVALARRLADERPDPALAELRDLVEAAGPLLQDWLDLQESELGTAVHDLTLARYELGRFDLLGPEPGNEDEAKERGLGRDELEARVAELEAEVRRLAPPEPSDGSLEKLRDLGYVGDEEKDGR